MLARVRAALRHRLQQEGERPVFRCGELSVDLVRRIVTLSGPDEPARSAAVVQLMLAIGRRSTDDRLRELGGGRQCAIMCAEAVWWRCHRRIIADYLISEGEAVFHILGEHDIAPASLTAAAKQGPDRTLIYPAGL